MTEREPGDVRAWMRTVLQRYEGPLVAYATRLTGDPERARDIVQETLLRFVSAGAPREDGKAAAWLFAVCRNRAISIHRKERRMQSMTAECAAGRPADDLPPPLGAERNETAARVRAALEALPEPQPEVLRLRFHGGLSYREIGEVLNLTTTHVGYLIHTGIKTLRRELCADENAETSSAGGAS